jgi:hypothetical protein
MRITFGIQGIKLYPFWLIALTVGEGRDGCAIAWVAFGYLGQGRLKA